MSAPICHYYFREWDCKLLAPLTMVRHPMDEIMDATNGCGREGIEERLVPDTIWGLDISPVCRVHDWITPRQILILEELCKKYKDEMEDSIDKDAFLDFKEQIDTEAEIKRKIFSKDIIQ